MTPRRHALMLLVVVTLASSQFAAAYKTYQSSIPNGDKVVDGENNPWPGVGHERAAGGGPRNVFGKAFAAAGHKWTKELCEADSDGDGLANGVELGDPDCKWSPGDTPQFDVGISHPGFASTADIERDVKTCDGWALPAGVSNKTIDVTFSTYRVPSKRTTYAKQAFNLADILNTAFPGGTANVHHGIRFSPLVRQPEVVHHMLLYSCATPPANAENSAAAGPVETASMPCTDVRYAWAVGGRDWCLPHSVGIEFPVNKRSKSWYVLEIHYDNPQGHSDIDDNSGVRIDLVDIEEASDAGVDYVPAGWLWAGAGLDELRVPPKQPNYHVTMSCSYPQIPESGVTVFASLLHGHVLARKIWAEVHRKNKYVHDATCNTAYDFDLQEIYPSGSQWTLQKGDIIKPSCVYDSTSRSETTYGGDATIEEMCIVFLLYYPEVSNLRRCLTSTQTVPDCANAGMHRCCDGAAGYYNASDSRYSLPPEQRTCAVQLAGNKPVLPRWVWIHAAVMMTAWGLLLPCGVFVVPACRRNGWSKAGAFSTGNFGPRWLHAHAGFNVLGLVLVIIGAIAAFANAPTHLDSPHKVLGLLVVIVAVLQPLNAVIRPHISPAEAAGPRSDRRTARRAWELLHRGAGWIAVLAAIVNCFLGAATIREVYEGGPGCSSRALFLMVGLGLMLAAVGTAALLTVCCPSRDNPDASNSVSSAAAKRDEEAGESMLAQQERSVEMDNMKAGNTA